MEELTKAEKRKLVNARYYAKKRAEKGKQTELSNDNLKLENLELKKTIETLKAEIKKLKDNPQVFGGQVLVWSDEED